MNDVKLLIGGKVVQARSAATFERRNPVSGAVVTRCGSGRNGIALDHLTNGAAALSVLSRQRRSV